MSDEPHLTRSRFCLRYVNQVLPLHEGELSIGRSLTCDLMLDSDHVSRRHAVLEVGRDRLAVRDLGSRFGTMVNGKSISGRRELRYGDVLAFGAEELHIVDELRALQRGETPTSVREPRRPKVLLVDDSRTVRQRVEIVLTKAGFQVFTVDIPFAATAVVESERPDLVLLDVGMPSLSGDQLATFLRKQPALADVKLVLYSSWPPEELARIARECGADGYMNKSPDPDELVAQCRSWIPWLT